VEVRQQVVISLNKNQDEVQTEDLFEKLPDEMMYALFRQFDHAELHPLREVSRRWEATTAAVHYHAYLQEQLQVLQNSSLWKHLPDIAGGKNILSYLESNVSRYRMVSRTELTLEAYCVEMKSYFEDHSHPYWKKLNANYIQSRAQFILQQRENLLGAAIFPDSLKTFLKLPAEHAKIQFEIYQAYLEIESLFAILCLRHQAFAQKQHANVVFTLEDYAQIICDPLYNRYLTPEGLLFLSEGGLFFDSYTFCLIEFIVDKSIADYEEKGLGDVVSQENKLLSKMKNSDWYTFFAFDKKDVLLTFRRVTHWLKVLHNNHHLLLRAVKEDILLAIANVGCEAKLAVLHSPTAVRKISPEKLINLASSLSGDELEKLLRTNSAFVSKFTFEMAMAMLERKECTHKAKYFLVNAEFLQRCDRGQVLNMMRYLTIDSFKEVLLSGAFLNLLRKIENPTERSEFLLQLAKVDAASFVPNLANNTYILKMLLPNDLRVMATLHTVYGDKLNALANKLDEEKNAFTAPEPGTITALMATGSALFNASNGLQANASVAESKQQQGRYFSSNG